MRGLCAGLMTSCLMLLSSPAQAEVDLALLTGDFEISRIDDLIADNADDPVVVYDLLRIRAESQIADGVFTEASETILTSIAFALRFPGQIETDIPALHLEAAELFARAGDLRASLEQLYAALDALVERAANNQIIGDLLLDISDLEGSLGNADRAASLRERRKALPEPLDAPPANRSDDPGYVSVDVYYATDRKRNESRLPSRFYGHERAAELDRGITTVTIPRTHQPGTIASPSIWRLEFTANPVKHVMVQSVTPLDEAGFFASMRRALVDRDASDAFVFVHGYNVSFDEAVKRTAQMAFDMSFNGAPILYSWPSKGATVSYMSDAAVVRLSGRRLTTFLEDVVTQSGATTVHIIAHSMGNRAVTDALELMALRLSPIEKPVFDQIIFAAPDVDRGLFGAMISTIKPLTRRMTLYASEEDWALEASRKLHGNAIRAGQGGEEVFSHSDIDTIDMSGLGEDMLAHAYVTNDQSALLDIATLFWRNPDPNQRCGLKSRPDLVRVWDYRKSPCASTSLLNIVGSLRNASITSSDQVLARLQSDFDDTETVQGFQDLLLDMASD